MKWLGSGEGDGIIKVEMDRGPHRTQDDAAVGYVFQRAPDPEFHQYGPKQLRWAHGDDSIIDNHDKWKYPTANNTKVETSPQAAVAAAMSYMGGGGGGGSQNSAGGVPNLYDLGQSKSMGGPPPEHLVYMSAAAAGQMQGGGMALHPSALHHLNQSMPPQQQLPSMRHTVQHQIAPAAKKLWGLEAKNDKSLALNRLNHDGVWRDPTWAAPVEHPVSAPLAMSRSRGGFAGDTGNILSPRGSDNGGLGVKMVEYVLGTSPTGKDNIGSLEPRIRVLQLDDKDKDKPQSPKEECVNGQPVQNGQVGDDDKCFKYPVCSRTPGSRQPSPAEEELNKNGMTLVPGAALVLKPQEELGPQHLAHHLPPHLAPHLGVTLAESVNQQFEHFAEPTQQQQAAYDQQQQQHQYPPPPPQPHQVDSAVLQQQQHNFDVQVCSVFCSARRDNTISDQDTVSWRISKLKSRVGLRNTVAQLSNQKLPLIRTHGEGGLISPERYDGKVIVICG